jgi:hyperosmotically inducible protein
MANDKEAKVRNKDDELKEQVQEALNSDKGLKSYGIRADVVEGQAQLHGIVDTLADKMQVERLVSRMPGIKSVDLAIAVSTDGAVSDRDVEFEVSEEFQGDPNIDLKHVGAKVSKGVVTLVGNTDDPSEIESARKAAAKARGVTEVKDQIELKPKELGLEEIFHSQVRTDEEKEAYKEN